MTTVVPLPIATRAAVLRGGFKAEIFVVVGKPLVTGSSIFRVLDFRTPVFLSAFVQEVVGPSRAPTAFSEQGEYQKQGSYDEVDSKDSYGEGKPMCTPVILVRSSDFPPRDRHPYDQPDDLQDRDWERIVTEVHSSRAEVATLNHIVLQFVVKSDIGEYVDGCVHTACHHAYSKPSPVVVRARAFTAAHTCLVDNEANKIDQDAKNGCQR